MEKTAILFVKIVIIALLLIIVGGIGIVLFVNLAPQFGQVPQGEALKRMEQSENYRDGVFQNLIETNMDIPAGDMARVAYQMLFQSGGNGPEKPLPVRFQDDWLLRDTSLAITWFGHSAVLLELEGKRILIDPMLGPACSPVSFLTKRYPYEIPIDLDKVEDIDAVVFSHDHYDHLDYYTVSRIKDRVGHWFTPLGLGEHLKKWGISPDKITELDWWEESPFLSLKLVCAPARHFSGRGLTDRNKTQWASWVIVGQNRKVYFSGDGGYGPHFKEIGEKFGPIDFAMVECGQYNPLWESIHMMPEQSAQAALDLNARVAMPIHWGAFTLSLHHWIEPIERFQVAAQASGLPILHPYIGERIVVTDSAATTKWWETIQD